jgi:hypothetical protein
MLRSKQTASSKKRLVSPPFPPRGLFFLRISYFAFLFFYDKKQEGKFMQNTSIIRNAFMALTSLFLLTGCVSGDAKTGYDKSLSLMKSMLKDPDSMKIKNQKYTWNDYDNKPRQYCYKMDVDGKNSFGAYTGYSTFYFTWDVGDTSAAYEGEDSETYGFYSFGQYKNGEHDI